MPHDDPKKTTLHPPPATGSPTPQVPSEAQDDSEPQEWRSYPRDDSIWADENVVAAVISALLIVLVFLALLARR